MKHLIPLFIATQLVAQIREHPTILYSVGGTLSREFFGDCVDRLDDVNGDGVNDIVVGAPFGSGGGRAVILSGRNGSQIAELRSPRANAQFGWEVAGAGNVVLVSAPQDRNNGSVFVYAAQSRQLIRTLAGEASGDRFGERIARLDDLNGDSIGDVIVGAPSADFNGSDSGSAYVFSGADGTRLMRIDGDSSGDHFGSAVGNLHDIDGDGVADLAISAYSAGAGRLGQVGIYSGRTGQRLLIVDADENGLTFGRHYIGEAGDIDRDGTADVITADIGNSALGSNTGRSYVISGRAGTFLLRYTGTSAEQVFGTGSKRVGDMNGDGVPDLFIGAAFDGSGGNLAGKAYLYSGRDGSLISALTNTRAGATFGARGVDLGDVNGDGLADLLIAAPTDGQSVVQGGRVFAISGASFPKIQPQQPDPAKRRRGVRH